MRKIEKIEETKKFDFLLIFFGVYAMVLLIHFLFSSEKLDFPREFFAMISSVTIEERDQANQHFDRGLSFDIRGKLDDAISEMENAVEKDPTFAEAFNKLGDFYMKKGWLPKAAEKYRRACELKPDVENSFFDLGCALASMGRFSEAGEKFEKALSIDPTHFEIYGKMGQVYLEMSMFGEAIEKLKMALIKDPSDIMSRYTLGRSLVKVNHLNEAFQQFNKVIDHFSNLIRIKERYAEGHYYIGRSYFFMQRYDKAAEYLLKAIEYDTDTIDYHFSFGMWYTDGEAFFALAETYFALNEINLARNYLLKALDLEPQNEKFLSLHHQIF